MSLFEITIQRKDDDAWPVVVRYQPGAHELTLWRQGRLDLDLETLVPLLPSDKAYGLLLGKALFRDDIRDAFVLAVAESEVTDEPLRVLLNVEAEDLRRLHWEQLHAPLDRGWDYLLLNQGTPFSLYLPSQIQLRFPPIGRRDLRALILVAGPEDLNGDYQLAPFEVAATVQSIQRALGDIPCQVLATPEGSDGPPTLSVLCDRLTAARPTLLHIVCHGAYDRDSGDTKLYFPEDERGRPVLATTLIERLGRLDRLPHFSFLSTCESADPQAEAGLGGLGQRLVRELGMPAVVAMTDRISIATAGALNSTFYARLREHGEVDRALCEALAGLQGRNDVTVPALFSRLEGRALWSDTLDRPLTDDEIRYGLEQLPGLLEQRAPVLLTECRDHSTGILASLGAEAAALSTETRRERDAALTTVNQICSEALDLSFNALALGQKPPDYDARCPFPGLSAFGARFLASGEVDQDDREFFFGREALIERLKEKLAKHNFLPILGPSGSGKSSLVVAGLIPALQEQEEEPDLQMAYLTPGSHPVAKLEASHSEVQCKPAVLVVDQFEELFTLCASEDERRIFLARLLALADEMRVVIAMRADFWGECALYPAVRAEMQARQELIAPMDASELRVAMERQAAEVGLRFEADLSNTILDDVRGEPGAMPLLQHALLELWNRRHGRWLLVEEYRDGIGGVQLAIAHTADALYEALSPDDQVRMRDIFLRLTRLGDEAIQDAERRDTRQRVRFVELVPAEGDPAPTRDLVQRLADARLVVTGPWEPPLEGQTLDDSPVKVEVAHEALIRHWPRLRGWLDEDRAELRLLQGLRQAALEWQARLRDEAYLVHRGGRLEDAEALHRQSRFTLNEMELAYLEACVGQEDQELEAARKSARRLLRLAVVLAVVLLLAVVAFIIAGIQKQQADRQVEVTLSQKLAAHTLANLDGSLDLPLLLSKEAYNVDANLDTRGSLLGAVTHSPRLTRFLHSHTDQVPSVSFSPDGKTLASGSWDHKIILWDLSVEPPTGRTLAGHTDRVNSVAFSPVGQTLASGSSDGTIVLWELSGHAPISRTLTSTGAVSSLAFDPDGQLLASGTDTGEITLWDVSVNPPTTSSLSGHTARVTSLTFSPDDKSLASGSEDEKVIIWDVSANPVISQSLAGHQQKVTSLAFSPDGKTLVSGGYDLKAIFWDVSASPPTSVTLPTTAGVMSVAFHPDDNNLLVWGSFDYTIVMWDVENQELIDRQPLAGHSAPVLSVAFSPDGRRLASGGQDQKIILWDAAVDRSIGQPLIEQSSPARGLVFTPSDSKLAAGQLNGHIALWDIAASPPTSLTLTGHTDYVSSVAASPDGRKLASGSQDRTVILWDISASPPLSLTLTGHSKRVNCVAFSADSQMLASGSTDKTIILWDISDTPPTSKTLTYTSEIWSLVFSPDGKTLASGNKDYSIVLWDLDALRATEPPLTGHAEMVNVLAFSPDGTILASASHDKRIIFWSIMDRKSVGQPLARHTKAVRSLSFSPKGDMLASSSYDGTIIVWNVPTRRSIAQLQTGRGKRVDCVAFSPDGETLASGSYDQMIMLWKLVPDFWADRVCQAANRNLSKEEWDRFVGPDVAYRCTCPDLPPGEGVTAANCQPAP